MPRHHHSRADFAQRLPFFLLTALLVLLWIAGGASRADVLGQVVTRAATWLILIIFILFAPRPQWKPIAPVAMFLIAAILLVALQLVPLPPSLWASLPGRSLLAEAAAITGQPAPWRPLSISPDATRNALSSLIVPVTVLLLLSRLRRHEHERVVTILLGLVIASALLALVQFSGGRFDHPLVNDAAGYVSASFANRNHLALFLAIGCLLTPVWALREGSTASWNLVAAAGLLLLFLLTILATGSRTGMILGAAGFLLGLVTVRKDLGRQIRRLPKPLSLALMGAFSILIIAGVTISVTLGRAVSVDRLSGLGTEEDLRTRALPTILEMLGQYFPVGSGYGTFDPAFRINEPDALLSSIYLNRAHNDLLEVVLDGGLPGFLLLAAALLWWLMRSLSIWRRPHDQNLLLPKLGSSALLLIVLASVPDYPARTPMIMAILITAAMWLSDVPSRDHSSAKSPLRPR